MFKLKQIQFKSNNAPDIEKKSLKYQLSSTKDSIFHMYGGTLTNDTEDTSRSGVLYLCLDEMDTISLPRFVKCFRITNDMIFKVRFYASGVTPTEGMRLKLKTNATGGYTMLQYDTGNIGEALVVGTDNYASTKNILIRFDKV